MSTITEAREQYDLGLREFMSLAMYIHCGRIGCKWNSSMVSIQTGMLFAMAGAHWLFVASFRDDTMVSVCRTWSYDKLRTFLLCIYPVMGVGLHLFLYTQLV